MAAVVTVLARAASRARGAGEQDFAQELDHAREQCESVMAAADACIADAVPNQSDANSYCVSVEKWDRLSAEVARMGGAI